MSHLVSSPTLREFFRGLLTEAISHQHVELADITELYLVNLLTDFVAAERLFSQDQEGRRDHEPLAILYYRALQQGREERIRTLRRLGDVSLYKAGFFSGALRHGVVGPDYYIQMGGKAYGSVASLAAHSAFAHAYRELCEKFRALVEVLEEISARGLASNGPTGTLKVYESWMRTKSDRLERVLVDAGIMTPQGGLPN